MSSKLIRRGERIATEPVAWRRVSALDTRSRARSARPATSPNRVSAPGSKAADIEQRVACGAPARLRRRATRRDATAWPGEVEAMQTRLARTIEELTGLRPRYRREAEQDVVALALAVARRILHRELTMAPEALLGLVKAALEKMEARELHRVRVSRADTPPWCGSSSSKWVCRTQWKCCRRQPPAGQRDSRIRPRDRSTPRSTRSCRRSSAASRTWRGGASMNLKAYREKLARIETCRWTGSVTELVGLLVESNGPEAAVGDFCEIATRSGRVIRTQVIGFRDGHVLSMPLEETDGLHLGDPIVARQGRRPDGGRPATAGPRDSTASENLWMDSGMPDSAAWTATLRALRRAAWAARSRADQRAAGHRHSRHRQPADLRQGTEHRNLRRLGRGQKHAAGRDGARRARPMSA